MQITHDLQQDITGRHLIIVEDILDSGNTLAFLKEYFMTKGAASITIVTLLDKPSRRTKAITADLAGFVVPDEFVVGYGLDYCQQYRNVPYIGVSSRRSTRTTETAGGKPPGGERAYHECPGWA
ncbi:MAG: phosphoribosyltransferase family protein [Dysosmobacter sp.]